MLCLHHIPINHQTIKINACLKTFGGDGDLCLFSVECVLVCQFATGGVYLQQRLTTRRDFVRNYGGPIMGIGLVLAEEKPLVCWRIVLNNKRDAIDHNYRSESRINAPIHFNNHRNIVSACIYVCMSWILYCVNTSFTEIPLPVLGVSIIVAESNDAAIAEGNCVSIGKYPRMQPLILDDTSPWKTLRRH